MGEIHEKNRGVKLPSDINNKREYLFFDQVPGIDILTPDNIFTEQRSIPDVSLQKIISENQRIYLNGQNIFSENTNDTYLKDEESMIPRGLLDTPYDKCKETEINSYDSVNPNSQQHCIPCYIAFLPPGNINERYLTNFGQFNGPYGYSQSVQVPPPPLPNYARPQANEFYNQYQRNIRTLNCTQPRGQQSLEFTWWNNMRTSPHTYAANPNVDMRMFNSQRNPNPLQSYEACQQISYGRYPFEYGQGDLNFNPNMNFSYEHSYGSQDLFQIPFSKTFHKSNTRVSKESETGGNNSIPMRQMENTNNILPNTSSIEEENLSQSKDGTSCLQNNLDQNSYPQTDCFSTSEDSFEMDSFHHAALYGCLQLEQILCTKKIVSEVDLKDCCIRMKNELSKSKHLITVDSTLKEMIFTFLHICNCWVSMNSVKSAKQGQPTKDFTFDLLVESFEAWETKSKVLLDSLIIYIQYMTSNNQNKDSCSPHTVKCANKPKETNQVLNQTESKKSHSISKLNTNKMYCLFNNNYLKNNFQEKEKRIEQDGETIQYSLSPETHRLEKSSDSGFICDNFMRELKMRQEKNKSFDRNKFSFQDYKHPKKNILSREQCSFTEPHTMNNLKIENIDKMFPNFQTSKIPLLNRIDSLRANEDYNMNKILNNVKKFEEEKNFTPRYSFDKLTNRTIPVEKSQTNASEGHSKWNSLDYEKFKKQSFFTNKDTFQIEEKELSGKTKLENNISPVETKLNDLGTGKRYSLRQKRKNKNVNFAKNKISSDNEGTIEGSECISGKTKLKMYDILLGIQSVDFKILVTMRITELDVSKIRQSLINPMMNVGHMLSRNFYKNMNDFIDDVYAMFYRAKRENKGNIAVLTVIIKLELRLMNTMFDEIGMC